MKKTYDKDLLQVGKLYRIKHSFWTTNPRGPDHRERQIFWFKRDDVYMLVDFKITVRHVICRFLCGKQTIEKPFGTEGIEKPVLFLKNWIERYE